MHCPEASTAGHEAPPCHAFGFQKKSTAPWYLLSRLPSFCGAKLLVLNLSHD